ncbi:hypothetical protein D8T55_22835 [Vibrio vulnificus]|nr:hypothetical protein D8T55_22835 [Vibrio vulnificus]
MESKNSNSTNIFTPYFDELRNHINQSQNYCKALKYKLLFEEHNAQLRGEQRYHPHLKHCAINTKIEVEAKVPSVGNPS